MSGTHFKGPVYSSKGFVGDIQATPHSIGSGEIASDVIQVEEVLIKATDVKKLRATPATLVKAPGAGKFLEFVSAQLFLDYSTAVFTESTYNLAVKLGTGAGTAVSATIETTGFIDQAADTITNAIPVKDVIVSAANGVNKALVLHNTGGAEIGGDTAASTLRVRVAYRVHDTGF